MNTTNISNNSIYVEPGLQLDELRQSIREEYEAVACNPGQGFHFHTGRKLAKILGYNEEWLVNIPESSIESFAGTGNPFRIQPLVSGERVVDVGCGAGMDSLIAAVKIAPNGRVIGVDMTQSMIQKAKQAASEAGVQNVEFRAGYAESLPVDDDWADVIISNGVVNLTPDKAATFREMARVLKSNGRLQISDILVRKPVPLTSKQKAELWTGCIAGALMENELKLVTVNAGFVDLKISWWADVYDGAPQASSAAHYGTVGINFYARKARNRKEWQDEMDKLSLLPDDMN
jgi:arsenite methyltransferase